MNEARELLNEYLTQTLAVARRLEDEKIYLNNVVSRLAEIDKQQEALSVSAAESLDRLNKLQNTNLLIKDFYVTEVATVEQVPESIVEIK